MSVSHITRFSSGDLWSLSNDGLIDDVYALAVSGTDLYVGGWFTQTTDGAVRLNRIAKLTTSTATYKLYLPLILK